MGVGRLRLGSDGGGADGYPYEPGAIAHDHRTYTTLLRSSGETLLRVLESSHRAMHSSLHPMAADEQLDPGAFLYAARRLPDGILGAGLVLLGQDRDVFAGAGIDLSQWR